MNARHHDVFPVGGANTRGEPVQFASKYQPAGNVRQQRRTKNAGGNPTHVSGATDEREDSRRIQRLLGNCDNGMGMKELQRVQQVVDPSYPNA